MIPSPWKARWTVSHVDAGNGEKLMTKRGIHYWAGKNQLMYFDAKIANNSLRLSAPNAYLSRFLRSTSECEFDRGEWMEENFGAGEEIWITP